MPGRCKTTVCFSSLVATLVVLAAPLAWPQSPMTPAEPTPLVAPTASSSAAQKTAALAAISDWLQRDFAAARLVAVDWINDASLPAAWRSLVLQAAIEGARSTRALDFDTEAEPAYNTLVSQLPAGAARATLHQGFGNLLIARSQFVQAESSYRLAIAEGSTRSMDERANLHSSLGVALAQQGRLDEALEQMLTSYRLYEQTQVGPSANLLRNIGGLSIYLEDWDQAVTFSRLAIAKLEPDDPKGLGSWANLAAALIEQGELEEALDTLQDAMTLAEAQGVPSASVTSNLGFVLRELGRTQEALAQFQRAADLNRAQQDPGSLGISLKNIGETLILLQRRGEAADVLQQSLDTYREADIKPKRLELYPVLVDNLEQLGRYQQALVAMREYRLLSEELASADAQTRIAELQTAFDLERRERELAESERERLAGQAELLSLQARQAREDMLRWLLLAGLVLLSVFLVLLWRSLRDRTRVNRVLAGKNAEIEGQRETLSETNTQLHRQSIEDELTRLGNRRSVRQLIESDLPTPLRDSASLLILVDLDRFKGINDRFGHAAGDAVLAQFADVLRNVADPRDVLVRWGGEEFLWLVAGGQSDQAGERCRALADQVRATRFQGADRTLAITCSMGAAALDLSGSDRQQAFGLALKVADAALYEAKTAGRDRWAGYERRLDDLDSFAGSLNIEELVSKGTLSRLHETDSS